MRFVIVTGMSGAGKGTALNTLEDAGYFCVDNLPIQLIKRFAEIAYDEQIQVDNVAIGVDIRSGRALSQLNSCLADLKKCGFPYEILFIECSDATLVKRYKETRRNHPNFIGWTRQGDDYHIKSGLAVVISNTCDGEKRMYMGKQFVGKTFIDSMGKCDERVIIDEEGCGTFRVKGKSASIWVEDGYYYYFGSVDYTAVKNTCHWVSYPNDTGFAPAFYSFDEDGRMIIDTPDPSKDGIVNEDGELYYYVNGVRFYAGLIQIDGDYYYVNSSCKVITNQRYWVSKTNDLLPAGFYNFDVDGKMTDAPIPTPDPDPDPNPDPEVKNGIVSEDGELYYYVNGVKTYAGLIQIDGNYYYVNSYCKVITSQRYWVSKTNNLLPATFYTFGADGKMVR